jgi:hypothetical protein
VVRILRLLNVAIGLALAAAPWVLDGGTVAASLNGLAAGALLVALAVPRGPKTESYGGWDRFVA